MRASLSCASSFELACFQVAKVAMAAGIRSNKSRTDGLHMCGMNVKIKVGQVDQGEDVLILPPSFRSLTGFSTVVAEQHRLTFYAHLMNALAILGE